MTADAEPAPTENSRQSHERPRYDEDIIMSDNSKYVTNEASVGLPPLQSSRKAVWDYYRLEFLTSGYPGRRQGDILHAHPIYGPYVIADYIAQYRRSKNQVYLDAAIRVANAAVDHMTPVGSAGLAFMYSPDKTAVSSKTGTFYSGLTQARYIEVLQKLSRLPGAQHFREPLTAIAASLEVTADDGGVARFTEAGGLIIEEYPSVAPDCTLNGWTTATCILRDYAKDENNSDGWEIFNRSVQALEELVPIYDVPELANSRYRLTGIASIQILTSGSNIKVTDRRVEMPGVGTFGIGHAGEPAETELGYGPLEIAEGESGTLSVSLSRLTWPTPNRVLLSIEADQEGAVEVSIGDGEYSPMTKNLPVDRYRSLGTFAVATGQNLVEVTVPWAEAELVAYPTNFGKSLARRQFNQYHWIHVDTLGKIAKETESDLLDYYHTKWKRYPARWTSLAEYQDDRITLERFDSQKHK